MNTYFRYLNYNTGQWRNAKSKIINNTKIILEGEEMKDKRNEPNCQSCEAKELKSKPGFDAKAS